MNKKTTNLFNILLFTGLCVAPAFAAKQLAKVNGKAITDADLDLATASMNEGLRASLMRDNDAKKELLNSVIDQELMLQAALKEKLDQSPQYKQAMEAFRRNMLANLYLEKRLAAKLTPQAVRNYFNLNRSQYNTDQAHAQHILLSTEEEAKKVIEEARKPNADFAALAEKFSKDPSAKNNRGDLGFFPRGQMVKEFSDPVFMAKPGTIVGPIKTDFGWHVVKLIEKRPGKNLEFEEVELQAKTNLRQELMRGLMSEMRKSAKIQYN